MPMHDEIDRSPSIYQIKIYIKVSAQSSPHMLIDMHVAQVNEAYLL